MDGSIVIGNDQLAISDHAFEHLVE